MKSFRRIFTVALSLVALAGITASCGGASSPAAEEGKNPVVKIGVVVSLTGADAAIGQSQLKAIKLANAQFASSSGPRFQIDREGRSDRV